MRDIDRPVPRDDEVLIRVYAAGVDPSVWHLMEGQPYLIRLGFGLGMRSATCRSGVFRSSPK